MYKNESHHDNHLQCLNMFCLLFDNTTKTKKISFQYGMITMGLADKGL